MAHKNKNMFFFLALILGKDSTLFKMILALYKQFATILGLNEHPEDDLFCVKTEEIIKLFDKRSNKKKQKKTKTNKQGDMEVDHHCKIYRPVARNF